MITYDELVIVSVELENSLETLKEQERPSEFTLERISRLETIIEKMPELRQKVLREQTDAKIAGES